MHYMGYVFVNEATDEAVAAALEDHKDEHWDWYRCGGRWDGHFGGETEMKRRETDGGFNFAPQNNDAARNAKPVADLDPEKPPFFFVAGYYFVPKEYYMLIRKSPIGARC